MWVWLRIIDSFDSLSSIQQSYMKKLDEWKEQNLISDVISTYGGTVHLESETVTLIDCNLYVCLNILGIQEDNSTSEIELSESEKSQLPSVIIEFTNRISRIFDLPIDFEGDGIESNSPPHVSIRHYWRALKHPKYQSEEFSPERLLKAALEGSKIGFDFYWRIKNSTDGEKLKLIVEEMWTEAKKVTDLSPREHMYAFHIAAHTIPKVFLISIENRILGGFVDILPFKKE